MGILFQWCACGDGGGWLRKNEGGFRDDGGGLAESVAEVSKCGDGDKAGGGEEGFA